MDKQAFQAAIQKLRESKKRKFSQSVDLIINLQQLDLKNPDHKVDVAVQLPAGLGREVKICGLVDKELVDASKKSFDHTVMKDEFAKLSQKDIEKLAEKHDYFVAQATLMVEIAKVFGKILGPRNKMPNPKMGCVIPPNANLQAVRERLSKTARLQTKKELIVKTSIGRESMSDEELVNNAVTAFEAIIPGLPGEKSNVRSVFVKLTMSAPVQVGTQ